MNVVLLCVGHTFALVASRSPVRVCASVTAIARSLTRTACSIHVGLSTAGADGTQEKQGIFVFTFNLLYECKASLETAKMGEHENDGFYFPGQVILVFR